MYILCLCVCLSKAKKGKSSAYDIKWKCDLLELISQHR